MTPQDLERQAALRAQAVERAEALRRAAIDDFWRGVDAVLATAATRTRRSAERLRHRLDRHTIARGLG